MCSLDFLRFADDNALVRYVTLGMVSSIALAVSTLFKEILSVKVGVILVGFDHETSARKRILRSICYHESA